MTNSACAEVPTRAVGGWRRELRAAAQLGAHVGPDRQPGLHRAAAPDSLQLLVEYPSQCLGLRGCVILRKPSRRPLSSCSASTLAAAGSDVDHLRARDAAASPRDIRASRAGAGWRLRAPPTYRNPRRFAPAQRGVRQALRWRSERPASHCDHDKIGGNPFPFDAQRGEVARLTQVIAVAARAFKCCRHCEAQALDGGVHLREFGGWGEGGVESSD